jgi:hypothetical protein
MKPREFFDLVVKMREAQKTYFQLRSCNDSVVKAQALAYAKRLEQQIDSEISRVYEVLRRRGT